MPITLKETKLVTDLATILYDFLPGSTSPYGNQSHTFPGCAHSVGIAEYWQGGSKKPAITLLLTNTLTYNRGKFCPLMICIVQTAIVYRGGKGNPITRQEIVSLNKVIADIGFKVPELWQAEFLSSLPSSKPEPEIAKPKPGEAVIPLSALKEDFINLSKLEPQPRGYAFETFLNSLFKTEGLKPRSSFRITGEQIDGSFEVNSNTYLLEAKWQAKVTSQDDLLIFSGKVGGKATWSRGLFISYAGFSKDGLEAFSRGKQTNLIGMDAQDLYFILEGRMTLSDALAAKARRAVETNTFFVSVYDLANQ